MIQIAKCPHLGNELAAYTGSSETHRGKQNFTGKQFTLLANKNSGQKIFHKVSMSFSRLGQDWAGANCLLIKNHATKRYKLLVSCTQWNNFSLMSNSLRSQQQKPQTAWHTNRPFLHSTVLSEVFMNTSWSVLIKKSLLVRIKGLCEITSPYTTVLLNYQWTRTCLVLKNEHSIRTKMHKYCTLFVLQIST